MQGNQKTITHTKTRTTLMLFHIIRIPYAMDQPYNYLLEKYVPATCVCMITGPMKH